MLLLCGATGDLGFRIARRLRSEGVPFRALVRPSSDAAPLLALGATVVRGDLLRPATLEAALDGVDVVVTTVSAIRRILAGERLPFQAVDRDGTLALVAAAERHRVRRFVYLSAAGVGPRSRCPIDRFKWACEERLRTSSMEAVIVRPESFMEVWLSPEARFDWRNARAAVFGRGTGRVCWVSEEDVAAACVRAAVVPDPPARIEFGGPEALSLAEVAARFSERTGRAIRMSCLPRPLARLVALATRPFHPAFSTLVSLGLRIDAGTGSPDARALRALGVAPTPLAAFISEQVSGASA